MNIAQWLHRSALHHPTRPALLSGETLICNYDEFAHSAAALGQRLVQDFGIQPGDRVGLFMPNRAEYLAALYAIWWMGAVVVPINAKLHSKEAAWILADAEAKVVFTSEKTRAELDSALEETSGETQLVSVDGETFAAYRQTISKHPSHKEPPHPRETDDLAWLFYTSGTTGKPKGVKLSHGNLVAMSLCYPVDVDSVSANDATLYAAPISHGAGLYNFIHVRCAARHVVPSSEGFDENEVLELAKALDNVSMFAAPTMVKRLVEAAQARGEHGEGIKTIVYGGGPMYLADIEAALDQLGHRFVQIYGQGESPMTITALSRESHTECDHPRYRQRLASVGTAHSTVQVRVTGEDGQPLPVGAIGEIEVKGPTVMLGYWKNPNATDTTLRDGWLRSGDLGSLDEDGFLTLHDRSKDVIISGGTNIYPREVEEALLSHPDVQEVSVIGKPDPKWGEIVIACIVTTPGRPLNAEQLDEHCLNAIARFKRPKKYIAMDALPKNNNGKILKKVLREQLCF